ncbi:hypothetical protein L7F22_028955 [Adiantum nelumboides]|nr:hypothetical protein [Adiantum nelumboides]
MVKLRQSQPTHAKEKDEAKTRTLLSFSNFRRSFTAPSGVSGRIPSSVEIANACVGLNAMGKLLPEEEPCKGSWHVNRCPLERSSVTLPDANTNSQVAWVLHEISNSAKQDAEQSPATQLAAAFNRWRYSHLKVSLYNELQKLQDLIVKEARFHQEKVGVREERHEDDGGSNASPFSTSLRRICNGLAHCLIEARNQILALAGNSESKICQTTASNCKPYFKLKNSTTSAQTMTNKSSDKTCQKTRFRFLRSESKGKKQKSASRDIDLPMQQEAADAEIFEFVGSGSANRHMAQGVEVDYTQKNCFTNFFLPTSVGKLNEIGLGHESFSELKT